MQPIQFFAARVEDGALLPGATVDVYLTGTNTRAELFSDSAGTSSLPNPLYADGIARVFFYTTADRIDIRISRGGYVAPLIEDLLVTDPEDVLAATVAEADRAAAQVVAAGLQADRAEAAASSSTINANVFDDTAAGLAATAEGDHFQVLSGDGTEFIRYRHDAGPVATEVGRYPSAFSVGELQEQAAKLVGAENDYGIPAATEAVFRIVGGNGRVIFEVLRGGVIDPLMRRVRAESGWQIYEAEAISADSLRIVGANGRIIQTFGPTDQGGSDSNDEVETARGTRASLNARISTALTPYGLPIGYRWGEWFMRETRQRLSRLRAAGAGQLVIAAIGDSWTAKPFRWCGPYSQILQSEFGNAGPGYTAFARAGGSGDPEGSVDLGVLVALSAAWSTSYWTGDMPSISKVTSTAGGASVVVSAPAGLSSVRLIHGGGGDISYRFDGGTWQEVTLSGSSTQALDLAGVPAGAFELEIVAVDAGVVLGGVDLRSASAGVRLHKLGCSGSRAYYWARNNAAAWSAGIQALAPNMVVIMLGTNDQKDYGAATFRGYVQTIVSRVRAALPQADVVLAAPAENGEDVEGHVAPMSAYAAELAELAQINGCAFVDLQQLFGGDFTEYSAASGRPWFDPDNIHPSDAGGFAIADALYRLSATI